MNYVKASKFCRSSLSLKLFSGSRKFFSNNMASEAEVQRIWRSADCVCFDVDSTVIQNEGLDDLAEFCGVGELIKEMTLKAMGGGLPFREALTQRLNIVNPSSKQLELFVVAHDIQLSPGISELVNLLHALNRPVYLVSGGFQAIIKPVADMLNVPSTNVFANNLLFDSEGNYSGFDLNRPTSETGGKIRVAQLLKNKYGYKNMVFIGDGVTDMETYPPADAFIGYGGNVIRASVQNKAKWFVTDFQDLIKEINES